MKLALLSSALLFSLSMLAGCAAPTTSEEGSAPAESSEDELRSTDLAGVYKANTEDDGYFFMSAAVRRVGTKLSIDLDNDTYELTRTRSGAYVFTSGDINGECDDPGCSFVSKISGVVYLKKVGTKKVASIKLTVKQMHPYPEYEGDIEGETTETLRWTKKAR